MYTLVRVNKARTTIVVEQTEELFEKIQYNCFHLSLTCNKIGNCVATGRRSSAVCNQILNAVI
ncbi:unnamed protein product [Schistosoma curassoni]|uniref:Uncharacterized protein n=1 Tax=Schistosoma curassoni TaxID=6186 RepID=A0A183K4Y8_9TREM|nr:unnamed protein product [Schistosoma curassoni]